MKSKSLGILLVFIAGVAVGYGLFFLDRQASIPRVEESEIFEVVRTDGELERLSYLDMAQEQEQEHHLKEEIKRLTKALAHAKRTRRRPQHGPPEDSIPQGSAARPGAEAKSQASRSPKKSLGTLFAKIFSQPAMQDLTRAQIKRQSAELTAVLGLTPEQQQSLETALQKRKKVLPALFKDASSPATSAANQPSEKSLDDEIRAILTEDQLQPYQEYTERKASLRNAPVIEKELLEVSWRLSLTGEQEPQVREILQEHHEKLRALSPRSLAPEEDVSPSDRFESYLQEKNLLNQKSAERMKTVLDEDQLNAFLQYQEEKDAEARMFQELIQSTQSEPTPPPTP